MTLLTSISMLLGCNSEITGAPDFENSHETQIDLNTTSINYKMPENHSSTLGFKQKRSDEHSRSIQFNPNNESAYDTFTWKTLKDLDGGLWDYHFKKDTATLNLQIYISPHEESILTEDFITTSYRNYYDAPQGLNTKIKSRNPDLSESELQQLLISPSNFSHEAFNGQSYLHWTTTNESSAGDANYYVHQLPNRFLLTFKFSVSISSSSEAAQGILDERVQQDIAAFMSEVSIINEPQSSR